MKKIEITDEEYHALTLKAAKWDALEKKISKYYCDATGEYNEHEPELKGDLCSIGEVACMAFGWL
jgi:hypothetical protein